MNKKLLISILLIIALALAACGPTAPTQGTAPQPGPVEMIKTPVPTPVQIAPSAMPKIDEPTTASCWADKFDENSKFSVTLQADTLGFIAICEKLENPRTGKVGKTAKFVASNGDELFIAASDGEIVFWGSMIEKAGSALSCDNQWVRWINDYRVVDAGTKTCTLGDISITIEMTQ